MLPFSVDGQTINYLGQDGLETGYRFFRELIYDCKLPLLMPVGICVQSPTGVLADNAVDSPPRVAESMALIAINAEGIIFNAPKLRKCTVCSEKHKGFLTSGNVKWHITESTTVDVISKSQHILTSNAYVSVRLCIRYCSGYQSPIDTQKMIGTSFYPLSVYPSLTPYLRVLPFDGSHISVAYENGMTPDILSCLIKNGGEVFGLVGADDTR
jgi:hypothetical protein